MRPKDFARFKKERLIYNAMAAVRQAIIDVCWPEPGDRGLFDPPAYGATVGPYDWAVAQAAEMVVEAFEIVAPEFRAAVFSRLDQDAGPGECEEWPANHWKLRRVRNTPGTRLFDVISGST